MDAGGAYTSYRGEFTAGTPLSTWNLAGGSAIGGMAGGVKIGGDFLELLYDGFEFGGIEITQEEFPCSA
jgi:hypothetical protein